MIKYIMDNKKGIILVIIGLLILTIMVILNKKYRNQELLVQANYETNINIKEPESKRELSEEEVLKIFLEENDTLITFLANGFKIDKNIFLNKLKENYQSLNILNTENLDYVLIEYLLRLEASEKELFDNTIVPCQENKEYIVALINYFTNIYNNVDFKIAAGIAQIESNYTATSMLNRNNVFGGMYNGSLIKYKTIEYGILKYVKLLNDGYFNKGLTTVEAIGKIYNPTYNELGERIAKPSWVANVNKAMEDFIENENLDVNFLYSLRTNS